MNKCKELGLNVIELECDLALIPGGIGIAAWVLTIDGAATVHEISGNVTEVLNELDEWRPV